MVLELANITTVSSFSAFGRFNLTSISGFKLLFRKIADLKEPISKTSPSGEKFFSSGGTTVAE